MVDAMLLLPKVTVAIIQGLLAGFSDVILKTLLDFPLEIDGLLVEDDLILKFDDPVEIIVRTLGSF
jgi:hypothetical protein